MESEDDSSGEDHGTPPHVSELSKQIDCMFRGLEDYEDVTAVPLSFLHPNLSDGAALPNTYQYSPLLRLITSISLQGMDLALLEF